MYRYLNRSDFRFILFLILLQSFFLGMALIFQRICMGDSHEYVYMALNFMQRGWFYSGNPILPIQEEYMTQRPPGYPLFLASVYLFFKSNWVVIVLQNLLSIFNIYFLRDTIRRLGYSRRLDFLFIALVALYPAQMIHANTVAPDILLQSAVLLYFQQFIQLISTRQWRYGWGMSLALIAGMMIKPVLYPFCFFHCLLMLFTAARFFHGLVRSFFIGLVPLLVLFAYMSWNGHRTGKIHFSSNQSFNAIYYYYFYFADTRGLAEAKAFLEEEREILNQIDEFPERYDYANQRGMELLKQEFYPYLFYHLRHGLRMLIEPGKGEFDLFVGTLSLGKLYSAESGGFYETIRNRGWKGFLDYLDQNPSFPIIVIVLLFNLIKALGLLLFFVSPRIDRRIRGFVFCLVAYFVLTTGPIANTRYFLPISLIVLGCAMLGFQKWVFPKARRSQIKPG